jgi:hypothetical protein
VDKVKLSLRLINHEGVWVNECMDPPFLKAYEIEKPDGKGHFERVGIVG